MTVFDLILQTISPIHIGEGVELRQDFDFVVHNESTYRLSEDAVLREKEDQLIPDRDDRYPAPGRLLTDDDFKNRALFRYALKGYPRSEKTDARVQSFIKDVYDRPYIPGSSLKGAFRTALAWSGWEEVRPALDTKAMARSRAWAGQGLEKQLFRPGRKDDPNHDLLRALHVSDLFGSGNPGQGLQLVNAQVLTRRNVGSPIELEALVAGLKFRGTLTIDESLFSSDAEKQLRFGSRRHWLDELMERTNRHSQARIEKLTEWFSNTNGAEHIARFYQNLVQIPLGPGEALMQFGWGSGWDGKTFWTHLQDKVDLFEEIINKYKLHRVPRGGSKRKKGDPFPSSRRVVTLSKSGADILVRPFGWVGLQLRRRSND